MTITASATIAKELFALAEPISAASASGVVLSKVTALASVTADTSTPKIPRRSLKAIMKLTPPSESFS